jgi:DNA polymerase I-like protein with 3'-5' exonuclease and polymerase domains
MGSLRRKVVQRLEEADLDFLAPPSAEQQQGAPGMIFTPVLVDTPAAFTAMLADLAAADPVAVDTETTGTDQLTAELVGISLCGAEERAYYVSLAHTFGDNLSVADILPACKTPCAAKRSSLTTSSMTGRCCATPAGRMPDPLRDTMIAATCWTPAACSAGWTNAPKSSWGTT